MMKFKVARLGHRGGHVKVLCASLKFHKGSKTRKPFTIAVYVPRGTDFGNSGNLSDAEMLGKAVVVGPQQKGKWQISLQLF